MNFSPYKLIEIGYSWCSVIVALIEINMEQKDTLKRTAMETLIYECSFSSSRHTKSNFEIRNSSFSTHLEFFISKCQ